MKSLAILALLIAAPAMAAPECYPSDQMVQLLGKAGEERRGFALDNKNVILELWMTPDNSSWTVIIVGPQGLSCVADYGENWNMLPQKQPGEPS